MILATIAIALRAALMRPVRFESDTTAAPDRSDDLVFTDQALPILQKVEQHIEYLGLNGNGLGTEAKFAPVRVKYVVCKNKMHVAAPAGWAIALKDNQGKLKNLPGSTPWHCGAPISTDPLRSYIDD